MADPPKNHTKSVKLAGVYYIKCPETYVKSVFGYTNSLRSSKFAFDTNLKTYSTLLIYLNLIDLEKLI